MRTTMISLALMASCLAPAATAQNIRAFQLAAEQQLRPAIAEAQPVDLAICLDVSGSMNGLLDSARQKIWAIVNDLALAEPTPRLRVALLTFGHDTYAEEDGWVSLQTAFTEDLDLVSQQLFALSTNGGTELVGRVMKASLDRLDWTPGFDTLKLMIVAGNESADQDKQFSFRDQCQRAIARGIMVNSIYCGNPADGVAPAWREVAQLSDGHFASIDQNQGTITILTPFDEELASLSTALNTTYLPYGANAEAFASNQIAQDFNAAACNNAVAAQRAWSKSNGSYRCATWDLVDACKEEGFELSKVTEEQLPENMRKMTLEERKTHIAAMGKKRGQIQQQVADLNQKREAFVAEEMQRMSLSEGQAFDAAVRNAIRSQATGKGYRFKPDSQSRLANQNPSANASQAEVPVVSTGVNAPAQTLPANRIPVPAPNPIRPASQQLRQSVNPSTQQTGQAQSRQTQSSQAPSGQAQSGQAQSDQGQTRQAQTEQGQTAEVPAQQKQTENPSQSSGN